MLPPYAFQRDFMWLHLFTCVEFLSGVLKSRTTRLLVLAAPAKKDDGWDETAYDPRNMRMEARIAALRDHLPDFLVENRKIYSILSKGIHELTEEDCAEAFSPIELGITLILDEEIEMKRKAAKRAKVSGDLAKLHAKHGA